MKNEKVSAIVLKKLDLKEADDFFRLHRYPTMYGSYFDDLYAEGETASAFTQRLLWISKCPYTIRLKDDPATIIGFCLIYRDLKKTKAHFLGGTLLPRYQDESFLLDAFKQIKELAKYYYGLCELQIQEKIKRENTLFIRPKTKTAVLVA